MGIHGYESTIDPLGGAKKRWEDEEEDSDVADNWDDELEDTEEEDEANEEGTQEKKALPVPKPQPKKKLTLKERIAQKQEERERREKEIKEAGGFMDDDDVDDLDDGTEVVDKRMADRRRQLEADISNTEDLFSGLTVADEKNSSIISMNPNTENEFKDYQKALIEIIQKSQGKKYYKTFLNDFIRSLALPLNDTDVRKMASTLTTLANDKQKLAREATKGKKKSNKKTAVAAPPKGQITNEVYTRNIEDDFLDFM
ncbi:Translation initiation factor 3 subunit J component [Mycoemilia scoparia]|uniref:Eukaryotic translation initiation factor 3 30 kDa subunit n=1 Tax=Mycoemilia scoparia TaxID=417184 RepID=A0A9W8DRY2_9FUNG|nr:Translation initiation factor 3 subunit J component [Mycoemilia scoparia]